MTQKALLQSAGDGTAVPSGYVGEIKTVTYSTTLVANTWGTSSALSIGPGIYQVVLYSRTNGASSFAAAGFSIDSGATTFSDLAIDSANPNIVQAITSSASDASFTGTFIINVTTTTNYYAKTRASSAIAGRVNMTFVRIA
jgi:hypothetical protein